MRKTLFKLAWDTRCRNVDMRRVLARFDRPTILDAGCGEFGLAAFMPAAAITGVDILAPASIGPGLNYRQGSIIDLPFDDRSFDIAVAIDVFEHLPTELRAAAVAELVRVARTAIVIAFPAGRPARMMDEQFAERLRTSGEPLPDWLDEHLTQPYPEPDAVIDDIAQAALKTGRSAAVSTTYSERLSVAKFLRVWALRSKYGYVAANLLLGMLSPLIPQPKAGGAYRSIILAEFADA
jgi:SAM-dependent methyltransferase